MNIVFIRHGATQGNLEHRYIGRTDEPLCDMGIQRLKGRSYPQAEIVVASPMLRCIQTAQIIYPGQEIVPCEDFRECDFGDFEGKKYLELSGDPDYQKWLDSGGTIAFPNGEHPADFRKRCENAFLKTTEAFETAASIAFVVHGGTIMAILSRFAGGDFYDYQLPNGFLTAGEFAQGRIVL